MSTKKLRDRNRFQASSGGRTRSVSSLFVASSLLLLYDGALPAFFLEVLVVVAGGLLVPPFSLLGEDDPFSTWPQNKFASLRKIRQQGQEGGSLPFTLLELMGYMVGLVDGAHHRQCYFQLPQVECDIVTCDCECEYHSTYATNECIY